MNGKSRKANCFLPCVAALLFLYLPLFSQSAHAVVPYHGMRMPQKHSDFYVIKIEAKKNEQENLLVDIYFSSAVDPRTVSLKEIQINGCPVPAGTTRLFNKAGTEVRFEFPETIYRTCINSENTEMKMELISAASFNGSPLVQNVFEGIADGYTQVFQKSGETGSD
jgi:hypothetical protein